MNSVLQYFKDNNTDLKKQIDKYTPQLEKTLKAEGIQYTVELVNATLDKMHEEANIKGKTTCGNCSFCCHSEINISSIEASYILAYIEFMKITPNKDILNVQNIKKWHKLKFNQKKCALLDEKGKCTIYQARPAICRLWNSTSDPILCKGDNTTRTVRILEAWGLATSLFSIDHKNKAEPILLHKLLNEYL